MKYLSVLHLVLAAFFIFCISSTLPLHAMPSFSLSADTTVKAQKKSESDATIQKKLKRNYEKNADELMILIKQHKFTEVEQFIDYVTKNKIITRHGEDYFYSLLRYWIYDEYTDLLVYEDFFSCFDAWLQQNEKSIVARLIRGECYLSWAWRARGRGWAKDVNPVQWVIFDERLQKAQQDYLYVYSLDDTNIYALLALFNLSVISKRLGRPPVDLYQKILKQDPANFIAHEIRLKQLMPKWDGNWRALFRFARATEKKAPPGTLLPLVLVHAHEEAAARSGNEKTYYTAPKVWADVERTYATVIAAFPHSGKWRSKFAYLAFRVGKEELAKKYWLAAIETDPDYAAAYRFIAWVYEKEKQWELEKKYAKRLVALRPHYARGHALLGQASVDLKKYSEAVEAFTRAIELSPHNSQYRMWRCWAYNSMQEFEKAIDDCTHALALNENNTSAYKQREHAYKKLGRKQEAAADCNRYEEIKGRKKKEQ